MIAYTVEVYPNGDKQWFLNDKRHREDGPAIEWANGDKWWYLNGDGYTEAQFKAKMNPERADCCRNLSTSGL